MKESIFNTVFYHIYPLGLCGCPEKNDFSCPAGNCFEKLAEDLPRLKDLGITALYIGPVFESSKHGYDTVDYYHIDRRLGSNASFKAFCEACHSLDIKVVLDAVFNHTGRDFFAFKDLQSNGWNSRYKDWYQKVAFDRRSPYGDSFDYEGWAGCKDLVKLNLFNPEVREHIFNAVKLWKEEFKIDGLRLDAADVLPAEFLEALGEFCRSLDSDFWLLGEVVHGDYNNWAKPGRIDSVTNYELYKGLWSSFNNKNFFELAYSLNRQFGNGGIYHYAPLYSFVDNHDVNRIASTLQKDEWLFTLYGLLFTIPGIPSIYYGSEYGTKGRRTNTSDKELRPALLPFAQKMPEYAKPSVDSNALFENIKNFAKIRAKSPALQRGQYQQVSVSLESFAFMREFEGEKVLVAVNSSQSENPMEVAGLSGKWQDLLNGESFENPTTLKLSPNWLRILKKVS